MNYLEHQISKDYFPEEYKQISEAWNNVVTKIKNQNKDE